MITACSAIVRTSAFLRAAAIAQGHSVLCAYVGVSTACPHTTGEPVGPSLLRGRLIALNDALDRGRLVAAGKGAK